MAGKYKIGVFGSSAGDMDVVMPKAIALGKALGEYRDQIIVVTGAGAGLPYTVSEVAAKAGAEIWGYPAAKDSAGLRQQHPELSLDIYSQLIYVPTDFPFADNDRTSMKYRNVISTANCDAGIFISGAWGTLNEFAVLTDQGKTAGILTGTGGIADELSNLLQKITKKGQGETIFNDDPRALVERILADLG